MMLISASPNSAADNSDRQIVLTFDDLPAQRAQGLSPARMVEITDGLLRTLGEHKIPAIGFVNEDKLEVDDKVEPARVKLLERWLDAGHELGNHSYSHPDLNRVRNAQGLAEYQRDVLRGEAVTRKLIEARGGKPRYFRHPFLRTGRDLETKRGFERFLTEHGYAVAPVTVDNSEWIFARAYDEILDRGDEALQKKMGKAYVDYMVSMVEYYEGQSRAILDREIPQILLLHANAINAHHLDALVAGLERRGYRFVGLDAALEDPAYDSADTYVGSGGITWLHRWAITRGIDRSVFQGEPTAPGWVQELAGIRESPRSSPN